MTVRWEKIQVNGSPMRAYVGEPDNSRPRPGIVVVMGRPGVDAMIQDAVHRLYRAGYAAAALDLYHWQPSHQEPSSKLLNDTEVITDMKATAAYLKTLPNVGSIGIVGFCLGGRASYLAAATVPEIKAAAVFYGGNIIAARGEGPTPFERTVDIHCPIIAFNGVKDANPSPEDMRKIDIELTRLNKVHEFHYYLDTDHAFMNFGAKRYRERAASAAWAETLAFFEEHLRQG